MTTLPTTTTNTQTITNHDVVGSDFRPPFLLRHPDIQNLLSSLGLRGYLLRGRSENMRYHTRHCVVDGGNGIRLSGEISVQPQDSSGTGSSGLVILLHGWEGSSQSAYLVSAASSLFEAGFTVFRLNMRDHGDSHHLNPELFNSTLLDEVLNAIKDIQTRWPHQQTLLAGFSLGGNFALRIALAAPKNQIALQKVVAVCPVIDPAHTLLSLQNSRFVYEAYFVRKWRKSLLKKLAYFPHYNYRDELMQLKDLASMHDFFIPRFTDYSDRKSYFSAYAIRTEQLENLAIPTHIISSEDDPITQAQALPDSTRSNHLTIVRPQYGSHCAFLKDFGLNSWVDQQLVTLFTNS